LADHLSEVASLAASFADAFGAAELAGLGGILHDVGKFSPLFQDYLRRCEAAEREGKPTPKTVPHSIHGALQAKQAGCQPLSFVISGHHGGVPDRSELKKRLANPPADDLRVGQLAAANLGEQLQDALRPAAMPEWPRDPLGCEVLIRMVFSALVDADWLDTERHFDPERARKRKAPSRPDQLWALFEEDQKWLMAGASANGETLVNRVRREVYEASLRAAEGVQGVYRLTVPTGGGKTRSGMAFALRHAIKHRLDRVIFAIPYTSIIDQTADVYRGIFGGENVVEHHSAIELPLDPSEAQAEAELRRQLAAESWDASVVVTTTVQLFESLFSNKPSRCRKLHNIARSVIVLDEVQTLPVHLVGPTLSMLNELVSNYSVTVVLCTATQPAFAGESAYLEGLLCEPFEIVSRPERYFQQLKRVEYELPREEWTWEQVATEMRKHEQVLAVVNSRGDALALLDALDDATALHLSGLLCAAHRREVLAEVRGRLQKGEQCRLVSTQVVEAGVDIDFPAVFRAIGPLDRIVQVAGRCNREGARGGSGIIVVFRPREGAMPRGAYRAGTEEAANLLYTRRWDIHDPGIFNEYFRRLWMDCNTDSKSIQAERRRFNYVEVAGRFEMIEGNTVAIVVSYGEPGPRPILDRIRRRGHALGEDWRGLQSYTVNLYRQEFDHLGRAGLIEEVTDGIHAWVGGYDPLRGITKDLRDPTDLIA